MDDLTRHPMLGDKDAREELVKQTDYEELKGNLIAYAGCGDILSQGDFHSRVISQLLVNATIAISELLERAEKAEREIDRLAAIKEISGDDYSLDHLRELVQADREGRCVVLPCKPSNVTIYQLRNKKHARGRGVSPRHVGCAMVWTGGHYALEHGGEKPCRDVDFGKTWFLTNEEARKALEETEK